MPETVEMKQYILKKTSGSYQRITVPASWKVTYGPIVPNRQRPVGTAGGFARSTTGPTTNVALRFYETPTQQRAIFTDVLEFRDASIEVEELSDYAMEIPQSEREARRGARRTPLGVTPPSDPMMPGEEGMDEPSERSGMPYLGGTSTTVNLPGTTQ